MKSHNTVFAVLIASVALMLGGCANNNFATSSTPAKIRGSFVRQSLTFWDNTHPWRVANAEVGREENSKRIYYVNPGPQKIYAAYTGNRGKWGILRYAGPTMMEVDLLAGIQYQLKANASDAEVIFILVNEATGLEVARSAPSELVLRKPELRQPIVIVY